MQIPSESPASIFVKVALGPGRETPDQTGVLAIKKGVLEIADLIAINKADGDNVQRAERAAGDLRQAMHILTPSDPNWSPRVMTVSGMHDTGLDDLWATVMEHHDTLTAAGALDAKRRDQQVRWMWTLLDDRLQQIVRRHPELSETLEVLTEDVRAGRLTATSAVNRIIAALGLG